jgi:hypothetical protein
MTVATPIEKRQVGLALESVRGTVPTAPTKFLSLTKDSNLDFATKLLADPAIRGYGSQFASFAGAQEAKGPLKAPVRASDIPYLLKMLLGAPTSSVEQASYVVTTGVNDKIDFNIGASQLHATVAAGTYVAGQTQADNPSLCKAIYDAIVAAEAVGTYTVSYSRTTGLFTITRSAGTFQIVWNTGTNKATSIASLIGFSTAADSTGALTYSSSTAAWAAWKHIFTQSLITQLPSYSFFINRGMNDLSGNPTKSYNLGTLAKLKLSGKDDAPVSYEASLMAQQEATYAGAWSPSYVETPVLMFSGTTVKVAGSAPAVPNIKDWSLDMEPGIKAYRPLSQTQYPNDFLATGPFKLSGDLGVYFMDEAERAKFVSDTITSLEFLCQGAVINNGTIKNTLDLSLPAVEYHAFPFGDEDGFLGAKGKFSGVGSIAAGAYVPLVTAYVITTVPASAF